MLSRGTHHNTDQFQITQQLGSRRDFYKHSLLLTRVIFNRIRSALLQRHGFQILIMKLQRRVVEVLGVETETQPLYHRFSSVDLLLSRARPALVDAHMSESWE